MGLLSAIDPLADRTALRPRAGRIVEREHRYHVTYARQTLGTAAGILVVSALLHFILLVSQVDRFRTVHRPAIGERFGTDPEVVQLCEHVARNAAAAGVRLLLATILLLLRFWAEEQPYSACRTGVFLYLAAALALLLLVQQPSWYGILMDVAVFLGLTRGAKSARALERLEAGRDPAPKVA